MSHPAALKEGVKPRRMTIEEFRKSNILGGDLEALVGKFNGGTFMECHTWLYSETGIWIDELVPVFQKLDAALTTARDLRPQLK